MSTAPHQLSRMEFVMSFNLAVGASASVLNALASAHVAHDEATSGAALKHASYDDGDWCPTKPHFPPPPPPPCGGNIGDLLSTLPGIGGGNIGDLFSTLPPIGGNVLQALAGAGGR
jgi:hypothetical protein